MLRSGLRLTENWHELNVADRVVAINDVHVTKIKDPLKERSICNLFHIYDAIVTK